MTVLNKHHGNIPADAIYIGRGSIWGNQYSHRPNSSAQHRVSTRDEACEAHKRDLEHKIRVDIETKDQTFIKQLAALHGKDLVCYCAPQRCHGHTLEQYAKEAYDFLMTNNITG